MYLKVNLTGHSLGGSLAQYINQYINEKLYTTRERLKEESQRNPNIEYRSIDNVAHTFNAANIGRLMNTKFISKRVDNSNNYRLMDEYGNTEILSYLGQKETIDSPFRNIDLISFQSSFNMISSHTGEEVYNSILIYEHIIKKYNIKDTEKGVEKINLLIDKMGTKKLLKAFKFINKYNLNTIEDLKKLPEDVKEELNNEDEVSLSELSMTLFGHKIENKKATKMRKLKDITINFASKSIPTILRRIMVGLTITQNIQTNQKKKRKKDSYNFQ